jgi:hypothetical protein
MNPDPELDASFGRQASVALHHAVLHLDGAAHSVDNTAELDDAPISCPLDYAAMMDSYGRVNEIAAEGSEAGQDSVLIGTRKPRIADDIGDQDRG